jgi:hypothetical protein
MDAAMAKTTTGGAVGDVCRLADGEFLGASSLTVQGITDPTTMEAIACQEVIALAQDLQLNQITVASDCLTVINALRQPFYGSFSMVIDEAQSNAAHVAKVTFRHENRLSNIDAHNLARIAVSGNLGRQVWLIHPFGWSSYFESIKCQVLPLTSSHLPLTGNTDVSNVTTYTDDATSKHKKYMCYMGGPAYEKSIQISKPVH